MTRAEKWVLTAMACVVVAVAVSGDAWSATVWDGTHEGTPATNAAISGGPVQMQLTKSTVRERLEVGHFFGSTSNSIADDNGLHRLGSARCYMHEGPASEITEMSDSHPDIGDTNLFDHLNTAGAGEPDLDNTASVDSSGLKEDDIGHGRCWIDTDGADDLTNDECTGAGTQTGGNPNGTPLPACCIAADEGSCDLDDNVMYTYLGVAGDAGSQPTGLETQGWRVVRAQADPAAVSGRVNYLTNNSFEFNATSAGTACDRGDTRPSDWSVVSAPASYAYVNTAATDGDGCAVVITADSTNDGIGQTLTNLQGGTSYLVTARVLAAVNDTCTLSVTAAATNFLVTSATTAVYETLTGTMITSTALDAPVVNLLSVGSSDICTWDHISVRRLTRSDVADVGIVAVRQTYTSNNVAIPNTFTVITELRIDFTPPTPGWVVQVGAVIQIQLNSADDDTDTVSCILLTNGVEAIGTMSTFGGDSDQSAEKWNGQIVMSNLEINPTAGTNLAYQVACIDNGDEDTALYNAEVGTDDAESTHWMIAHPPR